MVKITVSYKHVLQANVQGWYIDEEKESLTEIQPDIEMG